MWFRQIGIADTNTNAERLFSHTHRGGLNLERARGGWVHCAERRSDAAAVTCSIASRLATAFTMTDFYI